MIDDKYNLAKDFFYTRSYAYAQKLFLDVDAHYEAGLCALLGGRSDEARKIWMSAPDQNSAVCWGLLVCDFVELQFTVAPTYFQVRAFLEVYLNLLIENELFAFAENLISAQNFLAQSNPEAYKFIARVLFAHGYLELLPEFIRLSKECCFQDPEIHFIEAQMHNLRGDSARAVQALDEILTIVPDYFPARNLKKEILKAK